MLNVSQATASRRKQDGILRVLLHYPTAIPKRPAQNRRISARAWNHVLLFDTPEVGPQESYCLLNSISSFGYDAQKGEQGNKNRCADPGQAESH